MIIIEDLASQKCEGLERPDLDREGHRFDSDILHHVRRSFSEGEQIIQRVWKGGYPLMEKLRRVIEDL